MLEERQTMERERSSLECILVVLLVDKVTLGKSQKQDIGEELVAHFLRGRDGQVVHLLNHTVEQIGSPALSTSISSQAAPLTETDPVRLPNVSATWLERKGRLDRGNAGNSDLQRRISAKTCQAAFLQSHRPWL